MLGRKVWMTCGEVRLGGPMVGQELSFTKLERQGKRKRYRIARLHSNSRAVECTGLCRNRNAIFHTALLQSTHHTIKEEVAKQMRLYCEVNHPTPDADAGSKLDISTHPRKRPLKKSFQPSSRHKASSGLPLIHLLTIQLCLQFRCVRPLVS